MEMKSRASKVADADLKRQAQKYLTALLENLRNRFPQAHLLSTSSSSLPPWVT